MDQSLIGILAQTADGSLPGWLLNTFGFIQVLIGFSIIIFVHELGHFLAAKWVGIRVDRFAVGFGPRLFGWRKGEGFTFGSRPDYKAEELAERKYGETDYCFKALPIGGYVRMLGQDDIIIDEKTGDISLSDDPRSFTNRPVGQRMIVVSAGVVFNLIFAAVLLAGIFLWGMRVDAPVVVVTPESPAYGQLLSGDRVVEINGRRIYSYRELQIEPIFSDGQVRLKVERDGRLLDEEVVVKTTRIESVGLPILEVDRFSSPRVTQDWTPDEVPLTELPPGVAPQGDGSKKLPALKKGDLVLKADGVDVRSGYDVIAAFRAAGGRLVELTVSRPDPSDPSAQPKIVTCYHRPLLALLPMADPQDRDPRNFIDGRHLLGFQRRVILKQPMPGGPAEKAGLKPGDVIAEWGTIANPLYGEILEGIKANPGRPIRVVVERDGRRVGPLEVTPRRPFRVFGTADPRIQAEFSNLGEHARVVISDVVPGTPAAALNLPRGAEILAVDDRPVSDWYDFAEALLASAGRDVQIRYRSGSDEAVGRMHVPSSFVNELNLPITAVVWSINGENHVRGIDSSGRPFDRRLAGSPWAVSKLLEKYVGQTVTMRYSESATSPPKEIQFTVGESSTSPWQLTLYYVPNGPAFEPVKERLHANGNPLRALGMGVNEVRYWVKQVYLLLHMMFVKQNVGVENVSGPVGIVGVAVDRARAGAIELLYFLAFISVNLAVFNFLPLPVMDGGLMVFLLIEKIKGKPLSLKTQMISTLVGLAAIILVGLFVTIQDISRLFSG